MGTTASDVDVGENRLLTYSLTGTDASLFGVDSRTGVITASWTLVEKTYSFMVKATDKVFVWIYNLLFRINKSKRKTP